MLTKSRMEETKNPSNIGYYFILFQYNFNGYVKCWFDGNEYFNYMTVNDFVNLFDKANADYKTKVQVLKYLDTDGIYLWDVLNSTVRQVHNTNVRESTIGQDIQNAFKDYKNLKKSDNSPF